MAAYQEIGLSNGLQISAYQLPHLHSLQMSVFFKGGTLYENRVNQGISHLLEHLCFRNLNGVPLAQLYKRLDGIGAELDGTTYPEAVVFSLQVAPRFFDDAFSILFRLFAPGKWTSEEIAAEKQVVIRQIEAKYQGFSEDVKTLYWRTSAGGFPGMGTADSVRRMTPQLIHQWKKKIFRPANACFVLTGNYSDGMLKQAVEMLGEIPGMGPSLFEQPAPLGFCMRDENSDAFFSSREALCQVQLSFDIDSSLVISACANMLSFLTGGAASSPLFMELREKRALVGDIGSQVMEVGSFRRLVIDYEVAHERLLESLEAVFTILGRLRTYISQEQLDRIRVHYTDNEHMDLDSASGMNETLGFAWLFGSTEECDVETRARLHADLTVVDMLDAAQAVFRPETLCCFIEKDPKKVSNRALRAALEKCRDMLI